MRKSLTSITLLTIIPVFILISINYRVKSSFYMGKYDPQYCYLLNGVNVAITGRNIGHYDHPGTPVQILNACLIRTVFVFRDTNNDLQTDVLLYPELYLKYIAWAFTWINCLLLFISGFLILKLTGILEYGLIFQSSALLPVVMMNGFYRNCPEPVLFATSLVFSVLFFSRFITGSKRGSGIMTCKFQGSREIIFFDLEAYFVICAAIIGFMMAVKINSFPLLFIPLFFIRKARNKTIYLFLTLLFFIFFTLPIHHHYSEFFIWIKNLFVHSGYYGSGANDFVNLAKAWENFLTIIQVEPMLISMIFFSFIFLIAGLFYDRDIKVKVLWVLVVIQLIDLLVILKHFRVHYFLPLIALFPVNLILIFEILHLKPKLRRGVIFFILILFFTGNLALNDDKENKQPVANCPGCINVYAYGCNSILFGLRLGDVYAKRMNATVLERLYGKQWFYDYWTRQLGDWKREIPVDSLFTLHREIYLYTHGNFLHQHGTPFRLDSVSPGRYRVLSRN